MVLLSQSAHEYLEELRKQLVEPIENYHVNGFYNFHGEKHLHMGHFAIDKNGKIAGVMPLDTPSNNCPSIIDGKVFYEKNAVKISFLKRYANSLYQLVYYRVEKSGNPDVIIGDYTGKWQTEEKGVYADKFNEAAVQFSSTGKIPEELIDTENTNKTMLTIKDSPLTLSQVV